MEHLHTARRSASHGALHSAYSSNARPRRLQSVRENASFLASPGPLESMLKTTTETGDIGIFSIGTIPSAHTFHQLPRARTGICETNRPRHAGSRGSEGHSAQDDRRRLPSYRDTTSEILSMYGSDSQRSVSTVSRRFDDAGLRSYSLTSCGARPFQSRPRDGSMRACSATALQRPRSPFPYPTRLKRPGVRPASPALTENGSVDYSRMVGIDRVSYVGSPLNPGVLPFVCRPASKSGTQRTVHGSYKPLYPHTGRRPPPPSLRSSANQSVRSAQSYGPYPLRLPQDLHSQFNSGHARSPSSRDRTGSTSSTQSLRTSSLTSIIDRYRYSPLAFQAPHCLLPPGHFFYDYTEEFEGAEQWPISPPSPVAPIPTRLPRAHRPMVLEDDCDAQLHARAASAEGRPLRRPCQDTTPDHGDEASSMRGYPKAADDGRQGEFPAVLAVTADEAASGLTARPTRKFIPRSGTTYWSLSECDGAGTGYASIGGSQNVFPEQLAAKSKSPERQVEIQSPGKASIRSEQATILGADDQESTRIRNLPTIADGEVRDSESRRKRSSMSGRRIVLTIRPKEQPGSLYGASEGR